MTSHPLSDNAASGVADMDREHALELQIVRELQAALRASDGAIATELVARLEDFTNAHFLAEQILMRLHAYPGYAAHQAEHDRLIAELRELAARVAQGLTGDPAEEVERLERWLLAHMASEDHVLAEYLKAPAAVPPAAR